MKILHLLTGRRTGHVLADAPCPCCPDQSVATRPGEQPTVTITHRPLPRKAS